MWSVLARTVTLCLHLDVGCTSLTFTMCIQSGVGCIAQNRYTMCTFCCGLYCPELSHCVYILLWAVLPRTVTLCVHLVVDCIA